MPQLMPPVYIQMRLSNCFSSAFREPGGRELFRGDKLGDRAGDSRGDKNGDSSISWSTHSCQQKQNPVIDTSFDTSCAYLPTEQTDGLPAAIPRHGIRIPS
jgi:hypothetical protein